MPSSDWRDWKATGPAGEQVPARVRARVIALTRMTPPDGTGLSHWSTRELAKYLKRVENTTVSWHYIARIWREEHLKPHRNGTFKISKDPAFTEKVADVIGLYLDPPGGAVVLSRIRDYINSWNTTAKPFTWTATADEVLAKVRLVATNVKKLVNSNAN